MFKGVFTVVLMAATLTVKYHFDDSKKLQTLYRRRIELLRTRHKIDPWVISAGLAYRF